MNAAMFPDVEGARPEIGEVFQRLVNHWADSGSSWTGAHRLAMVAVVRAAKLATELPPWQSPRTVPGLIDQDLTLDGPAIDAAWRITNHPGTLTLGWYNQVIDSGIDEVAYVELVGVVAMANTLAHFCAAVGVAFPELPEPVPAPLAESPVGVAPSSHWVPTVENGMINIRKALSAATGELTMQGALIDALYVPGGSGGVALDEKVWSLERTQLELVASRVSTLNECFY